MPKDVFGLFRRLGCPGGGEGVKSEPPEGEKISLSLPSPPATSLPLDLLSERESSEFEEVSEFLLYALSVTFCFWFMSGKLVITELKVVIG